MAWSATRREDAAIDAVRTYLAAIAARDFSAACERLTCSVRHDVISLASADGSPGSDCADGLAWFLGYAGSEALAGRLADLGFGPVRIGEDSAEVDIPGPESPVRLRWEGGEWRISQLRSTATGRAAARLEAIEPL